MFWGNWDVGKRILLVDGSNLLFQMFFGMPGRVVNGDGVGIWGVIGFVGGTAQDGLLGSAQPYSGTL